jgi:hypothetical protein
MANMFNLPDNRAGVPVYYPQGVNATPAGPQVQYYIPRHDPVNLYMPVSVRRI